MMKKIGVCILFLLFSYLFCDDFYCEVLSKNNSHLNYLVHFISDFDCYGNFYITYWKGKGNYSPSNPCSIIVCKIFPDNKIKRYEFSNNTSRYPVLLIKSNNLFLAWHDYRNCTQEGNYMDNTEIYINKSDIEDFPSFSEDTRITYSNAQNNGDNGYLPCLFLYDNEVGLCWYDFYKDGNHSDIFLKISENLQFPYENMDNMLLPKKNEDAEKSFCMVSATALNNKIFFSFSDYLNLNNQYYGILNGDNFDYKVIFTNLYNGFFYPSQIMEYDNKIFLLSMIKNESYQRSIRLFQLNADTLDITDTIVLTDFDNIQCFDARFISGKLYFVYSINNTIKLSIFSYPDYLKESEKVIYNFSESVQRVGINGLSENKYIYVEAGGNIYLLSHHEPAFEESYYLYK